MHVGSTDDWMVLSNRLLLLQEVMVGLSQLPPAEVVQRAAEGVTWIFDGGALHTLKPGELVPPPLITRGRTRLTTLGEVYLAYFAGPPTPLYLALSGARLFDPQEFRLAALYFEHLSAALAAAGYREELARQAHADWLTGLPNRRSLVRQSARAPGAGDVAGLLEARPQGTRSQADHDMFQKRLAETLLRLLPEGGRAFRAGAFRVALFLPQSEVEGVTRDLSQAGFVGTFGWARQAELRVETLGDLLGAAEARLEAELARPSGPGREAWAHAPSGVTVHSGLEQVRLAVQERVHSLPLTSAGLHLLLDTPLGFALEFLTAETAQRAHTLVVTDSPSHPYLRDLLAQGPQGLVVGSLDDAALTTALERVGRGEAFYDGPALEDDDLYPREREVWRLVVRGLSNVQIAAVLGISEKTVANYVTNLQDKLFLNNRVELVLFYLGKLERPH